MSTIKSSAEDLTLNADGSGNDVIIQSDGSTKAIVTAEGNVGIGVTNVSVFNGVGGTSKLVIKGSDTATAIANNSDASLTIANDDGTAGNLAGLHFARADTDDNPHYAGASIVAQFSETQVTGQYPKGELAFLTSTSANTAPSEKMRILAAGGLTFNGDTAAANALDDYEEGTWTATVTSTAATFTPSNTTGYYTKVGNLVTISYDMYMAGAPSGTFTNTVSIQGLPFTSARNGTITWGHHRWTEFPSGTTDIGIQLDTSSTQLRFYARTGIGELTLLTGTVFKRNGSGLWITGHYYV